MLWRIWNLFRARNLEFLRDRSALGWNILFPFLVIIGFSVLFSDDRQVLYKVGVIGENNPTAKISEQYRNFMKTRYIDFVEFDSPEAAMYKLLHHRIDFLIDPGSGKYWSSKTSPKGYLVERLLIASGSARESAFVRDTVEGREIPYIEWLFPGILGMNMMFSALFGVGYVVVRYRKNGVLKRMSVSPLKPYEFLTAQIFSRMFLLLITTTIVFTGVILLFGFETRGSYLDLVIIFTLGGFSMISLALVIASRSSSEEFAGGILNLITWPMMFLSEVWFSLEGGTPWVQDFSKIFPLTHMIEGARKIMNDGAGIYEIRFNVMVLAGMTIFFLALGSVLFKWQKN